MAKQAMHGSSSLSDYLLAYLWAPTYGVSAWGLQLHLHGASTSYLTAMTQGQVLKYFWLFKLM